MNNKHGNKSFQIFICSILGAITSFVFLNDAFLTEIRIAFALLSGMFFGPLLDFLAQKSTEITLKWIGDDDEKKG